MQQLWFKCVFLVDKQKICEKLTNNFNAIHLGNSTVGLGNNNKEVSEIEKLF